jgi:hypothetical protein
MLGDAGFARGFALRTRSHVLHELGATQECSAGLTGDIDIWYIRGR